MPSIRNFFRSFSGGELSPDMFGQLTDVKYETGAARMRNFIATPQGVARNRPGTALVREVKDSTKHVRLIPFTYSSEQTMVVEMGDSYFRFHTDGSTLLAGSATAWNGGTPYAVGDMASLAGGNYYCILAHTGHTPPNTTYWYAIPTAAYEIPSPYLEADLFDIHFVESADVLTLVHPGYAPRELRRLGATDWTLVTITFGAQIAAPGAPTVTASTGNILSIASISVGNPASITLSTYAQGNLGYGDTIYISGVASNGMPQIPDGFYFVDVPNAYTFYPIVYATGLRVDSTGGAYTSGGVVQATDKRFDLTNYYVVTSIAQNGIDESVASSAGSVLNNLYVTGAYNTVSWSAVTGALRYNVYKKRNGLYGYIGQTDTTSFVDANIAPDLGVTPPIFDTDFASGAGKYPGAVSYFEQRRIFAGSTNDPQKIWMTRSGTESDMSYTIPVKDDNRIAFKVAAREASVIRHIVPMTQLILLTSSAEWRVSPVNSDSLTPTTISVRPQSYIGASDVQPWIVNNALVYCADRGGHVRELGYSWQSSGFVTGDLSLRAAHLFDGLDIADMCYCKCPVPILWFVSSNGQLLGLTYVPDQQIGAWHWHDTDGTFESCTAVAEGDEDVLYVVVKRTINGSTKRYVERMQTRMVDAIEDCFFVDCGLSYDGANTGSTTMTVTTGTTYEPGQTLTVTASAAAFAYPAQTDVHDAVVLTAVDGSLYRLTILATSSTTVATAKVDRTLASDLRATATLLWSFARDSVSGLSHLEGKTVSILADGAVKPQATVTSGAISIDRAASKIIVGLPYDSDLQTLPLAINIEAFGQGRTKNLNKAWLRVNQSSGIFVGPDSDNLVEFKQRTTEVYGTPPDLITDEVEVMLTPSWQQSGQVFVRQSDPLPLSVVGITLETSVGG